MSIDAKIRNVNQDGDAYVLDLEPRWDARVRRFQGPGQDILRIEPPITRLPAPGMVVWGNSGTVVIVLPDHSEWRYERIGVTRLREAIA